MLALAALAIEGHSQVEPTSRDSSAHANKSASTEQQLSAGWVNSGLDIVGFAASTDMSGLELGGDGGLYLPTPSDLQQKVVFCTLRISPSFGESPEEGSIVKFYGATLGWKLSLLPSGRRQASLAHLAPSEKQDGGVWEALPAVISAGGQLGRAKAFQEITVRYDLKSSRWDIFVGGILLATDLPSLSAALAEGLLVAPGMHSPAKIFSKTTISGENPYFVDVNANAIPDDFESRLGINPVNAPSRDTPLPGKAVSLLDAYKLFLLSGRTPD